MTEIEDHEALEMETNGDSQEEMSPLTGDMSTQSQDDGLDDIDDALWGKRPARAGDGNHLSVDDKRWTRNKTGGTSGGVL